MSFEHEQFNKFIRPDYLPSSAASMSSSTCFAPSADRQPSPRPKRVSSAATSATDERRASSRAAICSSKQQRAMALDDSSSSRKRAFCLVGLKLALLCCWLAHELASGFDESQCVSLASSLQEQSPPMATNFAIPLAVHSHSSPSLLPMPSSFNNKMPTKTRVKAAGDIGGHRSEAMDGRTQPSAGGTQIASSPGKVPKRRRKVILRRRLLRKGANGSEMPKVKGAIRRVVWRVVPLDSSIPSDGPLRTKTGTVLMRKTDGSARRRKAAITGDNERTVETSSTPRNPLPSIAASLSVPEQLNALISLVICFARVAFDCWCLAQCFCSAFFLLGLLLARRLMSMVPILLDLISIALAVIFGLSVLMFTMVLLFLLPKLPLLTLLQLFAFASILHIAIAAYGWLTYLLLKTVDGGDAKIFLNGDRRREIEL